MGRYDFSEKDDAAEMALVVEDPWQDKGLGAILLKHLPRAAAARGIQRFRAYVLTDNERMLRLLARHTNILEQNAERGVVDLLFTPRPE